MEKEIKLLLNNYLIDLKKKEIDKFERAKLLDVAMREYKLSQRGLAQKIGVPHSTIQDWMLVLRLTEEEYSSLKRKGLNGTEIYRELRNNVTKPKENILENTRTNKDLKNILNNLKGVMHKVENDYITFETENLLMEIINICNRFRIKIEKMLKK